MKSTIFILVSILLSHPVFAGQGGNGGDVVVCYDKSGAIRKMESYDFWNASRRYSLQVIIDEETPYMDQLERSLKRLEKIDPFTAQKLAEEAKIFSPENILKGERVGFVPGIHNNGDGVQTIIPSQEADPECDRQEILRIAEFTVDPLPFEKQFKLSKYLWESADEGTKFAVVQHELIYKYFKKTQNEQNSMKAQLFNAYISSEEFKQVDFTSYVKFILQLKMKRPGTFSAVYAPEMVFEVGQRLLGDPVAGLLIRPFQLELQGQMVEAKWLSINKKGTITDTATINAVPLTLINGKVHTIQNVGISDEGMIIKGKLLSWTVFDLGGEKYPIKDEFIFYANGEPQYMLLAICSQFKYGGKVYDMRPGEYWVYFDEAGNVSFNRWYSGEGNRCEVER